MKFFYKDKDIDFISKDKILNIKEKKSKVLIARYKFDKSIYENLIPEFNAEFSVDYEIVDEYLDTEDIVITNIETMMIMNYDAEPDEYGILTTEETIEDVSTFSAENIVTRSIYSYDLPTMVRFGNPDDSNSGTEASKAKFRAIIELLYLDGTNITTCELMFHACNNINYITPFIITDKCTNMFGMLSGCQSLTTLDVSNFNTSNVTTMSWMFYGCQSLISIDVSNWNTSKVTNMDHMFQSCYKLTTLDISKFNTSNVTDMQGMFRSCYSLTTLGDTSNWDTSNVKNMNSVFYACESLTTVNSSDWDVSNVTDMSYMFHLCFGLEHLDVFNWDVSNVTDMSYMFYCCGSLLELDFSRWDVSNVINMELLFCNCCSFSQNTINGLRNWDVSNVENMYAMIDCLCLNDVNTIDLSGWDVSNVIDMRYMLEYNTELKYLNLNNWILNENVDTTELLIESNNLEEVSIMDSNTFTINKIIAELPTRTSDSMGTLNIAGVDDISQIDIDTLNSKYWTITSHTILNNARLGQTKLN